MIWNIGWRVGLSVFLLVATLQVAVSSYALERVRVTQWQGIDDDLFEEFFELEEVVEAGRDAHNTKRDERFYSERDPRTRCQLVQKDMRRGPRSA